MTCYRFLVCGWRAAQMWRVSFFWCVGGVPHKYDVLPFNSAWMTWRKNVTCLRFFVCGWRAAKMWRVSFSRYVNDVQHRCGVLPFFGCVDDVQYNCVCFLFWCVDDVQYNCDVFPFLVCGWRGVQILLTCQLWQSRENEVES